MATDVFHLVIDTSRFPSVHFVSTAFERLLLRSRAGTLRIYIPQLVLEERRTQLVEKMLSEIEAIRSTFERLTTNGQFSMLVAGIAPARIELWDPAEIKRNSKDVFKTFVDRHHIEVIEPDAAQMAGAWNRYFETLPPFDPEQKDRTIRRKDIPDAWIVEAAATIKGRAGRHCALVRDDKLEAALAAAGFEIFQEVEPLEAAIEKATALYTTQSTRNDDAGKPERELDQLRGDTFKDVGVAVLGFIHALDAPSKRDLFDQLESAGVDRKIAEHEAQGLVLSGVLEDTGNHFIPREPATARKAMESPFTTELLLKII
jgi:hypothetical protein